MPPPGTLHGLCQVTPQLYLSNVRAASDASVLQRFNISCIINVSENKASHPCPGVDYVHIPVADSPSTTLCDHFHRVADKIDLVCRSDGRTLVHCNAGVSRSATLCIAYLMKHHNNSLLEAHGWVRSSRPIIRPNVGFWKQLIDYEKELRGCTTVEMISSSIGEIPDLYEEETKNMLPF
ncbi:dual specificity protein phosphatase 14 [Gadus macrocephalus]|uniref:dual specificity protein phosphatase 14 n=1 Tax=Gadus macrocephalus TaxID=80720 RepID=UPI0028CB34C6|nr:dual specificity protein phosphatase 14 [Gadus macrocephalus]